MLIVHIILYDVFVGMLVRCEVRAACSGSVAQFCAAIDPLYAVRVAHNW